MISASSKLDVKIMFKQKGFLCKIRKGGGTERSEMRSPVSVN